MPDETNVPDTLSPNDRALFGEAHYRALAAAHALREAQNEHTAAAQRQQSINTMLANKYALADADRLDLATGRITRNAVPAPKPINPAVEKMAERLIEGVERYVESRENAAQ